MFDIVLREVTAWQTSVSEYIYDMSKMSRKGQCISHLPTSISLLHRLHVTHLGTAARVCRGRYVSLSVTVSSLFLPYVLARSTQRAFRLGFLSLVPSSHILSFNLRPSTDYIRHFSSTRSVSLFIHSRSCCSNTLSYSLPPRSRCIS